MRGGAYIQALSKRCSSVQPAPPDLQIVLLGGRVVELAGHDVDHVVREARAAGSLRTSTRPTLIRRTESAHLYEH